MVFFDGETLKSISRTRYPLIFSEKKKKAIKMEKPFHIIILSDHSFNSILHS
jgi:hypothetical protein